MMDARDNFSHEVAAYLQTQDPEVRVCNWSTDADDHSLLPTVHFVRVWSVLDWAPGQFKHRQIPSPDQNAHVHREPNNTHDVEGVDEDNDVEVD